MQKSILNQKTMMFCLSLVVLVLMNVVIFESNVKNTNNVLPSVLYTDAKKAKDAKKESTILSPNSPTPIVDAMQHHISILSDRSFHGKIGKFRDSQASAVLYHDRSDQSKKWIPFYNKVAEELKGIVFIASMDCTVNLEFCKSEKIDLPTLMIFPPLPRSPYKYTGKMDDNQLKNLLSQIIPSHATTLKHDTIDGFLNSGEHVPKVIHFGKTKGPGTLFKALSNSFHKNATFGYVDASDTNMEGGLKKYSVGSVPKLMLWPVGKKKPVVFNGEKNFGGMHQWLNIYSETFAKGGGFSDAGETENKRPWRLQSIPELTKASHTDICFQKSKANELCVVYVKEGTLTPDEISMLETLAEKYTSHIADRGNVYNWMWIDATYEKNFVEMLGLSKTSLPGVALFNTRKRLRFTTLEEGKIATSETIDAMLENLVAGNTRFTNVKGQALPAWADRSEEADVKGHDEL